MDGHVDARRHPRRAEPVGDPAQTYKELGHTVELVEPVAGLPDMVYAANGGLLVNGKAVGGPVRLPPTRRANPSAYAEWMTRHGFDPRAPATSTKDQGDLLGRRLNHVGRLRFPYRAAGSRRDRRDPADAGGQPGTRRPALLPPRHRAGRARRPPRSPTTHRVQRRVTRHGCSSCTPTPSRWPADAYVLGLNAVSDGLNVVLPAAATGFAEQLRSWRVQPIGVDLSELLKGGGSVKCCTLEVHP